MSKHQFFNVLLAGNCILTFPYSHSAQAADGFEVLDKTALERERLLQLVEDKPTAYLDNYFSEGDTSPVVFVEDEPEEEEPDGVRFYNIETRAGFAESERDGKKQQATEAGVRSEYRIETRDYGEFVVQADTRTRSGTDDTNGFTVGSLLPSKEKQSSRVTVRNLGMPVTEDILADTDVGDVNLDVTPALARNYRFTLGNSQVRGARTRLHNETFDLRMGSGQRGNLVGGPFPGYEKDEGTVSWAGYSHHVSDEATVGVQASQAKGIPLGSSVAGGKEYADINAVAASVTLGTTIQQDGDKQLRVSALTSRTERTTGTNTGKKSAKGVFLEGEIQHQGIHHQMGAYRTDPELRSADDLISAGAQGAYWRMNSKGARLNMGGGVDVEQQRPDPTLSGNKSERVSLNANAHYVIDSRHSVGGNATVGQTASENSSAFSSTASKNRSINASGYYQLSNKDWGRTRLGATVRQNEELVSNSSRSTGVEVNWEQEWLANSKGWSSNQPEFSTTLGVAQDRSTQDTQTYPTAGMRVRYWPNSDWNVGGSLNWTSRTGNLSTSQGLAGTLNTEYTLNKSLSLGANVSLNQARVDVDATALSNPIVSRTQDKTAYVYLRWGGGGGKPYATQGNRTKGKLGSGSVRGLVFFDANQDGVQQIGENGVPDAEVWMDERYQARTDATGAFEFLSVATGSHQLGINLDSLPLPWGAPRGTGWDVEVPLRGEVNPRIPIVKMGLAE